MAGVHTFLRRSRFLLAVIGFLHKTEPHKGPCAPPPACHAMRSGAPTWHHRPARQDSPAPGPPPVATLCP